MNVVVRDVRPLTRIGGAGLARCFVWLKRERERKGSSRLKKLISEQEREREIKKGIGSDHSHNLCEGRHGGTVSEESFRNSHFLHTYLSGGIIINIIFIRSSSLLQLLSHEFCFFKVIRWALVPLYWFCRTETLNHYLFIYLFIYLPLKLKKYILLYLLIKYIM